MNSTFNIYPPTFISDVIFVARARLTVFNISNSTIGNAQNPRGQYFFFLPTKTKMKKAMNYASE